MDALLRNIWVRMCCCCRLPANKIQTVVNTGGSIQRLLKPNIITLHNSLQVHVKFSGRKKVFIYFIFYVYLKRMGLNLSTNLPMFVYTFQAMLRHRPLKEYSVFVGIRAAHTFFSPFTLKLLAWFGGLGGVKKTPPVGGLGGRTNPQRNPRRTLLHFFKSLRTSNVKIYWKG